MKESESEVAQSCPTLCDPVDCNPPGSSVHWILQATIPEWVAISFFRGSSRPRDRTRSPASQADALTSEPPGKPTLSLGYIYIYTYTYIKNALYIYDVMKNTKSRFYLIIHFFMNI